MALSFSSHFDSFSFIFPASENLHFPAAADDFFWPPETEFLLPPQDFVIPEEDSVFQLTESFPHQDFAIPEADSVLEFDRVIIPPAPEFIHLNELNFITTPPLLPNFQPPVAYFSIGTAKKQGNDSSELSGQSIAARKRRRRISEKTQELGKLIPGGNKMNTADMFQSAAKYVKFLQAQLAVLQLTTSLQEPIEVLEEMEKIVTSQAVQKGLYSEEKCLVPTELLHALAIDELLAEKER